MILPEMGGGQRGKPWHREGGSKGGNTLGGPEFGGSPVKGVGILRGMAVLK